MSDLTPAQDFAFRAADIFGGNPLTAMGFVATAMAHPEWGQAVAAYYRELISAPGVRNPIAGRVDAYVAALPVAVAS